MERIEIRTWIQVGLNIHGGKLFLSTLSSLGWIQNWKVGKGRKDGPNNQENIKFVYRECSMDYSEVEDITQYRRLLEGQARRGEMSRSSLETHLSEDIGS